MIRSRLVAAALGLGLLLGPALVSAQLALGDRRVVRYAMRGADHEFVLPSGWDGQGNGDGFMFTPPAGRVSQPPFVMAVIAVERQAGFNGTSQQVAEFLAGEDKKTHPTWTTTTPDAMTFVGTAGTIMMLGGNDEKDASVSRAIMYVVSLTPTDIYYLRAEGTLNDTKGLAEDIVNIIGGVRRLEGGASPAASSRDPSANPTIDDPAWGLRVSGIQGAWDLRVDDDAYVLLALGRPEAEVRVSRPAYKAKAAFEKQVRRNGQASKGNFAGQPALVVDRSERSGRVRTYYLEQKTFAFAVEVRAPDLEAIATRVLQVEPAFRFGTSSVAAKRTGVNASMSGGVGIQTTSKWKVGKLGAGRVTFVGPRAVAVEVKVFNRGKVDPWDEVPATATQQCELAGGRMQVSEIAVLGASKAMRYRCKAKDAAALLTLAEGPAPAGGSVFVRTVSQYQRVTAELPDAESAEFLTFLRFTK